jgi:hypothetical protein
MNPWEGKRPVVIVSACMSKNGTPDFAVNEVEVTHDEYQNGVHYDLVEDRLADAGYEEPIVHFDEFEGPAFLIPAVEQYLAVKKSATCAQEVPNATQLV